MKPYGLFVKTVDRQQATVISLTYGRARITLGSIDNPLIYSDGW